MARRFWVVLALLLVPAASSGQQGAAVVSGRVLDITSGAPIGFASIVVENAGSGQSLSGALTGEDGRFRIQGLAPGEYTIAISFPGFQPAEADVLVSPLNQAYDLGDIRLPRLENFQETVTVTADAIRAEGIDTQVFRLGEGPAQSTGTLLDALKGLPGVTVDQEGKVSLRGSDRVAILIDGRQSSLTGFGSQRGLDGVSAANVEAIEIIHNPSARFDAAGMAGIINIIYRQDQQLGLSGDSGISLGNGQFTKQRADLPTELGSYSNNEKIIPSLNLNYRTGRMRSFVQGELLLQHDLPNNEFHTRVYDDGRVIESQVPENREQLHYIVKGGTDWTINTNTLSVSGIYDWETHTDRAQVPFILQSTGERERFWFWREKEDTGFANASFNARHRFATPGHEINANLQYTRGWEDEAYFLNEVSRVREGTDNTHVLGIENTLPLAIDYTRPLRAGRLELGSKLQRRWLPVTYTVGRGVKSVIYQGLGDYSDWDEDLYAAYANLVHAKSSFTLEGGLRAEYTDVTYAVAPENIYYDRSDAYSYFELFPNAKLTYRLGRANRLIAAYNRRIDRPTEADLRIFPKYDDPELLKVGNPFLRPQLTHALELGLGRSWNRGSATASLYHRDVDDAFSRVFAIDDSNPNYNIVNKIFQNAGNFTQTGVQVILEQGIVAPWRVSGSVNWFVNDIDAFTTTLLFPRPRPFALAASRADTWDLTLNNRLQLPRAGELQVNYIYYATRNVPQGRQRARSSLDVAARWPILNERAEFLFTFTDIFNDFAIEQEVDGQGFTALYQNFLETQVATAGLRVRF